MIGDDGEEVFSTLVEVFPTLGLFNTAWEGLLHARGGVSKTAKFSHFISKSSPRSWRCFLPYCCRWPLLQVFSTLVEVFLVNRY